MSTVKVRNGPSILSWKICPPCWIIDCCVPNMLFQSCQQLAISSLGNKGTVLCVCLRDVFFYFCFWQVDLLPVVCNFLQPQRIQYFYKAASPNKMQGPGRCDNKLYTVFISWNKVKMHCSSHSKMSLMINKDGFMIHMFLFYNKSNQAWLLSKLSLNLLV